MAARYWVGGTDDWNGTPGTKWALTDGGVGGQTVPGSSDTVFFTALSGAVTVTWFGASSQVVSINCTGFTGTLVTTGQNKTLNGTGMVWLSPATCTIIGASTLTASSTGSTLIQVSCNHASPSATNAPSFVFNLGTYPTSLTGNGFRNITVSAAAGSSVSGTVSLYGNLTILSTSRTFLGFAPTFLAAATISTSGKTIGNTTVNAAGATVTTSGALTLGATNTFTLTDGTLSLGGTLSTGIFSSSNTNTRAIAFGINNIALTSTTASAVVLDMSTATNFTMTTSSGGFTRNQAATSNMQFGGTGATASNACNLTVNAGSSQLTISSGSYFRTINFTGSTCNVLGGAGGGSVNTAGNLTLAVGGTYTSVGFGFVASATVLTFGRTISNMSVNGSGITVTLGGAVTTSSAGNGFSINQGTLDLAGFTLSTSIFTSSNTNTRAITFGSSNIALTSTSPATTVLDMGTATGFTFTGTGGFTRIQVASATVRFGTTGGTVSNAPNLSVNGGGTANLTISNNSYFKNLNFTGSSATASGSYNACGNLTFESSAGLGSYSTLFPTFLTSATITSVGKRLGGITVNGSGITVTLADALTLEFTATLTQGTFTAANFNVTAGSFSSSNSNTRTLDMGSGTWTISGSGATAWNTATTTGLTVVPSTSTITMTSILSKTFAGGGLTYYNLNQGSTGSSALTISGSNTFDNITNTSAGASVTFTAGTTQTVSNFGLFGTAGNLTYITSTTPGSQFTLSKASGTVDVQYLSIQDSNATGGAVWNALLTNGNVNAGNYIGWIFDGATGNMFFMF